MKRKINHPFNAEDYANCSKVIEKLEALVAATKARACFLRDSARPYAVEKQNDARELELAGQLKSVVVDLYREGRGLLAYLAFAGSTGELENDDVADVLEDNDGLSRGVRKMVAATTIQAKGAEVGVDVSPVPAPHDNRTAAPHDTDQEPELPSAAERCEREDEWPAYTIDLDREVVVNFQPPRRGDTCEATENHDWRLDHSKPLIVAGKILSHETAVEPAFIYNLTCAKCFAKVIVISRGAGHEDMAVPSDQG